MQIEATGDTETIDTGLVLTSIGYRGVPIPGVPFDERASVIPNENGRVLEAPNGDPATGGVYATGWIKRGPSGFIGTNKSCAQETIRMLVDDFNDGRLTNPVADDSAVDRLVRARQSDVVDREAGMPSTRRNWNAALRTTVSAKRFWIRSRSPPSSTLRPG